MNTKTLDVSERASRLVRSIQDRAWQVAYNAGIPRDMCCLHNASIDDNLKHWCFENPSRLREAKRAVRMIDGAWAISDLAERIRAREWNKVETCKLTVRPLREPINVKLLFAQIGGVQ